METTWKYLNVDYYLDQPVNNINIKNVFLYRKYFYNLRCICIIFWETYPLTAKSQNLLGYDTEIYC